MADMFDVLRRGRDAIMALIEQLEVSPVASGGASEDELRLRKKLIDQLIKEQTRHQAGNREYIWPLVRDRIPDGDRLADDLARQEQRAARILARIGRLSAADGEFDRLLIYVLRDGRARIHDAEKQMWPQLRRALSQEEANNLAGRLDQAAPARPRQDTAADGGVRRPRELAMTAADMMSYILTALGSG